MDLDTTLAVIDAATGCQQCEGPLNDSPSNDFCALACQEGWHQARSVPLENDREPVDLIAALSGASGEFSGYFQPHFYVRADGRVEVNWRAVSRLDRAWVDQVIAGLRQSGIDVVDDPPSVPPSTDHHALLAELMARRVTR